MGKYMFLANYNAEGARGLLKDGGTARRKVVDELAGSVGGSVETFYYAFGSDDAYVICDLPDDEAAASIAATVGASGSVSVRTVVLLTAEQIDEAVKRSPAYRPPGQ